MDNVNININSSEYGTELYLKKVLAGNSDTVRLQLLDALEVLGYDIIEDQPNIIARRGAKGWAGSYMSANALDYPCVLTLRLKSTGENSTRVTFDYLIKHTALNKGDKNLVLQEAKTIAALSKAHTIEKLCPVCETESTDDSKFCRKCGAPLTSESAELEVLRVSAEARAAKVSVVFASLMTPIATIAGIIFFLIYNAGLMKPKLFPFLMFFCGLGLLGGLTSSFFAWNRLKRAIEKPAANENFVPPRDPETIETAKPKELHEQRQAPASVTEGTTNLLDNEWKNRREKEKVPASKRRTTRELN
ncbi:MAG: zinc ribbon domain-containing protein [Pyrinomonadaceae bacterium]|nr:zinc ribbon domain-containing protein [Pyrinomonadaceae bacterium]